MAGRNETATAMELPTCTTVHTWVSRKWKGYIQRAIFTSKFVFLGNRFFNPQNGTFRNIFYLVHKNTYTDIDNYKKYLRLYFFQTLKLLNSKTSYFQSVGKRKRKTFAMQKKILFVRQKRISENFSYFLRKNTYTNLPILMARVRYYLSSSGLLSGVK